jgi:hypothetical protein
LGTEVTSAIISSDMAGSTKYEFDSFDLEPEDTLLNDFEYAECAIDISFLFNCNEVFVQESDIKLQTPKVCEEQVQEIQGEIQQESSLLKCFESAKRKKDTSECAYAYVPFKYPKVENPYLSLNFQIPYPTDPSSPCVKFRVFKKSKTKSTSGMPSAKREVKFRKRKLRRRYPPVKDKVLPLKYSRNGRLFSNCFKRSHFQQDIRVPWKLDRSSTMAKENTGIGTHCLKQTIHRFNKNEVAGSSRANLN